METQQRRQIVLILALLLAVIGIFFFGYRAGSHARHMRRRYENRQNEPIRAWMSVPFIAHTHHVDPKILFQAVGLPPQPHDRRSLRTIARDEKRHVDDVIHAVETAIATARGSDSGHKGPDGKGP